MTLEQFESLWKRYATKVQDDTATCVWQISLGIEDDGECGIIANEELARSFKSLSELVSYLESQLNESKGDAS